MGTTRILYMLPFLANAGTERQLMMLVNGLDKAEYTPYVVALYHGVDVFKDVMDCEVRSLHLKSIISFDGLKRIVALIRFVQREKITYAQTYFVDATFIGILLKMFAGVSRLITCRRDLGFAYTKNDLLMLRFMNRFVDAMIVNSQAVKATVIQQERVQPNRISVIHNGVRIASAEECAQLRYATRLEMAVRTDTSVVGMVGNLRQVKRHDLFVSAAYEVLQVRTDVLFIIVGSGQLREALEERVTQYGIESHVRFLGEKAEPTRYIAACDIGVNCSDSEGFPNSVLEYMACGIACVVTQNEGNAELVENEATGLSVACNDQKALANAILRLLSDPNFAQGLARAARTRVATAFGVDRMIREYADYYRATSRST